VTLATRELLAGLLTSSDKSTELGWGSPGAATAGHTLGAIAFPLPTDPPGTPTQQLCWHVAGDGCDGHVHPASHCSRRGNPCRYQCLQRAVSEGRMAWKQRESKATGHQAVRHGGWVFW